MWKFLKGIFSKCKAVDTFEALPKDSSFKLSPEQWAKIKNERPQLPPLKDVPRVKPKERIVIYVPKNISPNMSKTVAYNLRGTKLGKSLGL